MKDKLKKVLTTTIISAVSATAIGCSTTNTKLAKNIDKSMAEFVSSINNLDYVETSSPSTGKIGKIVETSALSSDNTYARAQNNNYLSNSIDNVNVENTITRPSERSDNFKLYVLSESPYISFTSDNDSASLNMYVKFSTNKIEETSDEISTKINELILKRSILMIYVNEIYSGNVTLTEENKVAIGAYVNVIKENASFLKGNRGMVKNQLNLASDLINKDANENLVNYYIIKSGEALETRSNKIDSTISAIDSIIDILEINLTANSPYYQKNISSTYENILDSIKSENTNSQISAENKEIADNIAESLNIKIESQSENNTTNSQQQTPVTDNTNNTQTQNDNSINVKNLNLNLPQNNQNSNLNIRNSTNEIEYRTNDDNTQSNIESSTLQNHNTLNQNNTNSSQTTNSINSQNNTQNTTRNTNRIRPSRRVVRNNNENTRTESQRNVRNSTNNSPTISTNNNRSNSAKSVVNMDNQNNTTIRAERTPESHTKEEYTSSRANTRSDTNRATRVPYRTNTTFRQ